MNDRQQSNSAAPTEVPDAFPDRRAYIEVVTLAKSLGYADWEVLEAVDCSGLAITLGICRGKLSGVERN